MDSPAWWRWSHKVKEETLPIFINIPWQFNIQNKNYYQKNLKAVYQQFREELQK